MQRLPVIRSLGVLAACLAAASAQGWLDTARWYVQPTAGEFHYAADFDHDGDDDLVWFAGQPGTPTDWTGFRVFFNDGTGDFPVQGPLVTLPAGPGFLRPLDIDGLRRLGDVTGDGQVDVLVLEEPSGFEPDVALHVHPGLGGGAFGAPVAIPLTGDLRSITLGQIDADPEQELAIVMEVPPASESTRWYDWNGASFDASAEAFIFGGISSPDASFLVALDLQGDGVDDLVFGQAFGINLRVLPTVDGAPIVGQILTLGGGTTNGVYPYLCDLQGGGPLDLLVAEVTINGTAFALTPVFNVGGTLVAGTRQPLTAEGSMYGQMFDTGDWDGDGDQDVLVFAWQEPGAVVDAVAALFENDGTDHWGTAPACKADLRYAGGQTPLGLLDLDQDGHLDVVGPQSAWFGRGRFEDSLVEVTSFFYSEEPAVVLDHEGDGDQDLFHRFGLFIPTGFVLASDGTGAFPSAVGLPAGPPDKILDPAVAIADLTADGRADYLVAWSDPGPPPFYFPVFDQMRLYVDDGLGAFVDGGTASETPIKPYARKLLLALDLDDDGDNDLLDTDSTLAWRPNDGAGHFDAGITLVAAQHEAGAAADLDADGDTDLLAFAWPDALVVEEQAAPLVFVSHQLHEDASGIEADSPTLADPDVDGDLDVACATQYSDTLLLFENQGDLNFSLAATLSTNVSLSFATEFTGVHLLFDDIDGDGVTDLLAGAETAFGDSPDKVALFHGSGGGFDFEPVRWYAGAAMGPPADLDGDGDLDLSGQAVVRSRRFDGPQDGIIRQYGTGTAATSGAAPLLGAAGPLRPGSESAELRVRRAVGGKLALLLYGLGEADIPGQPFASSTLYVQPPYFTLLLVLGGTPGVQGEGTLDLGLTPVLPVVVGLTLYHQLAVFGGAGNGKTVSNGLQLTYGL